jgi:hypothetical protein
MENLPPSARTVLADMAATWLRLAELADKWEAQTLNCGLHSD